MGAVYNIAMDRARIVVGHLKPAVAGASEVLTAAEGGAGTVPSALPDVGEAGLAIKAKCSAEEWQLRVDLAAAYRACALEGWDDSIFNHFTVRIPGTQQFLINRYGEGFAEVTASSLVKIDHEGAVIQAGSRGAAVNKAGFVIHSAVHEGRGDAMSVMHTHEAHITAVSAMECGLLPISQTALLCGHVVYHDYEGVALEEAEKPRLVSDLGPSSGIMILRNHGVLTVGQTVAEAFTRLYYIHQAAKIQVKAMAAGGGVYHPHKEVKALVQDKQAIFGRLGLNEMEKAAFDGLANATFAQFKRKVDGALPGYDT